MARAPSAASSTGSWLAVGSVWRHTVAMSSPALDALTQALARLPGLGPRSARRAVLHLIKKRETSLGPLISALQAVERDLVTCGICGNVDTADPCAICTDPRRDLASLCVVEEVADLWALDRVRPEDLGIAALVARVAGGGIGEVVLAMNATLEGQTTMHYVAEQLAPLGVRVMQLAHGLPVGGELDYLDEGTLALALRARRLVD